MASNRRTHKFINSWAQVSIAAEVVLHALLLVALVALLLFAPPFVTMFSQYSLDDHQAIARELLELNSPKWPLFALLAVFIGIVSILFSHHIVGPAYRLRRVLTELKARNLNVDVKFRKWDYFGELEEDFNRVIRVWKEDVKEIAQHQREALSACRDLQGTAAAGEKLGEIEEKLRAIDRVSRSYGEIS